MSKTTIEKMLRQAFEQNFNDSLLNRQVAIEVYNASLHGELFSAEMPKFNTRWMDAGGTELVVVQVQTIEVLLEMRDEYSALLTKQGKNLHGLDQLTPEKRYGE